MPLGFINLDMHQLCDLVLSHTHFLILWDDCCWFVGMGVSAIYRKPLNITKEDMINLQEDTNLLVSIGHQTTEYLWRSGHLGQRESFWEGNSVGHFGSCLFLVYYMCYMYWPYCFCYKCNRTWEVMYSILSWIQMVGIRLSILSHEKSMGNGS